jgi:multiple sugar transport system permease protein
MATTVNTQARELNANQAETTVRRRQTLKFLEHIGIYVLLVLIALVILIPLAWMLSTSFKPKSQLFLDQIYWIPKRFTWKNYTDLLSDPGTPIVTWFINSIGVALVTTLGTLAIDALAAYAYARMEFPGRKFIYGVMLATLFMPSLMFLIPNFVTIFNFQLLNSYAGVILPYLAGVFGVFFLRQFFESVPRELEEAALIDGANAFQTFFRVVLPLARPALATLAVITFLASWNDFLWPLLILQNTNLQTLPLGLRTLQGAYTSEYGLMMAGAVVVAIPVLILYIALQRFIVQSVASTGLKG